jgi:DNA modification methylase
MIKNQDSLEFLKEQKDFSIDINYSDPPYALGSEIVIGSNGKPTYKKAVDFMNKWDMPSAEFWEEWFKQAFRICKYGGYVIMFGIDRQLLLFKYYSALAGFIEKQSLYWYFISNFPKSSDLSKNIDKHFGAEREVVGTYEPLGREGRNTMPTGEYNSGIGGNYKENTKDTRNIEIPSTPLAQKYNGYKYSIAPLKQTCETIMIFQKPYKTGSCMHDVFVYENGDTECCCGAIDVDGNRCETSDKIQCQSGHKGQPFESREHKFTPREYQNQGRYPAQTFVSSEIAEKLDEQSGISKGFDRPNLRDKKYKNKFIEQDYKKIDFSKVNMYSDIGGCSKILHKCDYEKDEHNLYIYEPKVNGTERNDGCDSFEGNIKGYGNLRNKKNNHPTLKPISLNEKILRLFKTPNPQKIIYPFAGSGSEVIGGIKAGFGDWSGCEINPEYIKIANARIKQMKTKNHIKIINNKIVKGLNQWL